MRFIGAFIGLGIDLTLHAFQVIFIIATTVSYMALILTLGILKQRKKWR